MMFEPVFMKINRFVQKRLGWDNRRIWIQIRDVGYKLLEQPVNPLSTLPEDKRPGHEGASMGPYGTITQLPASKDHKRNSLIL
jgi:hypothetical protein